MIAALLFINHKGEVVISRMYRDGFSRSVADTFRTQVIPRHAHALALRAAAPAREQPRALKPCGVHPELFWAQVIASKEVDRSPVKIIGDTSFMCVACPS